MGKEILTFNNIEIEKKSLPTRLLFFLEGGGEIKILKKY